MVETRRIFFQSGWLKLEGVLHSPLQSGKHPAVLVCHPHPLYGGDMYNNVVTAVCDTLAERGRVALRFNFRGVGASAGAYARGEGEQEDVQAALAYLAELPNVDAGRMAVVGYSFGAWTGLAATAADPCVQALVGISPPLPSFDFRFLATCLKPTLLLYGTGDDFVDGVALDNLVAEAGASMSTRPFPGIDHFWLGRERPMAEAVADFLAALGSSPATSLT